MQEESESPEQGKSPIVLLGVILFEIIVLTSCVVLGIQLFHQIQAAHRTEELSFETTPTIPTEEPSVTTGPALSPAELAIQSFCAENGLSPTLYPEELVALLERNPETLEFVLNYPLESDKPHQVDLWEYSGSETMPLFLQWDTRWGYLDYGGELAAFSACGPTCLSMVVCFLTGDYSQSPDKLIQFAIDHGYCVPGNGSSWTLISEGGKTLGLDVTEIPLDQARVTANLEAGNPIICVVGPGDFTSTGHYIVLTGLEDGRLRINDPNSRANSERLWDYEQIADQILDLWVCRNLGG